MSGISEKFLNIYEDFEEIGRNFWSDLPFTLVVASLIHYVCIVSFIPTDCQENLHRDYFS